MFNFYKYTMFWRKNQAVLYIFVCVAIFVRWRASFYIHNIQKQRILFYAISTKTICFADKRESVFLNEVFVRKVLIYGNKQKNIVGTSV